LELITGFINILLHLDKYLNTVIQNYGAWTNLILFIIIFCETGLVVTPFLPGDSLLFAAGTFAAVGSLGVKWLLILLATAAVVGDTVNYSIGHFVGPKVFYKENVRFLNKRYLERAHEFYERHGGKAIILARFIPIVRTFVPFVAGIGQMNYLRFISYNVIGGIAWVVILVSAGYFFGNIPIVKQNFTLVIYVIIFISILPGIIEFVRHIYHSESYIRINHLIKSASSKFKPHLKKSSSKASVDKWILVLVSLVLFLPWIKLPLSGGVSSFNFYSPILLSWGLLLLPITILTIVRARWFLFPLLVIVLSFPLQTHWNYEFVTDASSEVEQYKNISQFADKYLYESNFAGSPEEIRVPDISDLWVEPWPRVVLTIESLGIGFWIALTGTIIVSRRLGTRRILIALLLSLILSLPGILTASFLTLGRNAFLAGNYSKSVNMYKRAMGINQSIGNRTLGKLKIYYVWVGETLFHLGINDAPEVYFFLGKNLEGVSSFIKSREMYQKALSLPPAKKSLATVLVREAADDFKGKEFGSAMERLEEAFKLDNNQIEALFYATYISSVLKDQKSTLYYSSLLFDRCREKIVFSDLYNIIGDMYQKTEDIADARATYKKSIGAWDRVKDGNYHAWVGIAGW